MGRRVGRSLFRCSMGLRIGGWVARRLGGGGAWGLGGRLIAWLADWLGQARAVVVRDGSSARCLVRAASVAPWLCSFHGRVLWWSGFSVAQRLGGAVAPRLVGSVAILLVASVERGRGGSVAAGWSLGCCMSRRAPQPRARRRNRNAKLIAQIFSAPRISWTWVWISQQ